MVPRIGMLRRATPWGQLALSLALMLVSIWAVVWFASRLYRVGILMYGKRADVARAAALGSAILSAPFATMRGG